MAKDKTKQTAGVVLKESGVSVVLLDGKKVAEVSADGKEVTTFAKKGRAQIEAVTATSNDGATSISEGFDTVALKGVTVKKAADGRPVISVPVGTTVKTVKAKRFFNRG